VEILASAATTTVAVEFSKSDMLIALITAEGLIFAALSVAASLAGSSTFGPKTLGPS